VVELRMLGPVGLWTAGGLVELGPARQRTVLVALAVDAGRPVPVETLIDRVWDEDPPGGARAGLYSYLTRIRRTAIPSNRRDLKLADLGPPACSRSLLMGVARSRGPGRAEGPSFGLGLDPGEDDAMLGGREQAGHAALLGAGPAVEVCS
jgi:hypothetical protein